MKAAAVLCPGPSLTGTYPGPEGYGLVVGVNRAATVYRCDVWTAVDAPLVVREWRNVLGDPVLVTSSVTGETVTRKGVRRRTFLAERLADWLPVEPAEPWTLYSATVAVVTASFAGARRIDLFGADMTGTKGLDAADAGENRSDERWARERGILARVVAELAGRGVAVSRVEQTRSRRTLP